MAEQTDQDVATRAPESDSQAQDPAKADEVPVVEPQAPAPTPSTMLTNDTPAQTGPTMGEHCTTDRPLPESSAQAAGEETTINTIACYVSKPPSYPQEPGKLLLLLTGGTGIKSINNRLQADAYAARGFLVVMPDQFNGDPAPNMSMSEEDAAAAANAEGMSFLDRIKLGAVETAKSFLIDMWLARHTAEKVLPILHKVLSGAKEEFADAVASGGGVYGVGYCFGAKYVLILCGEGSGGSEQGQTVAGEQGGQGEATTTSAQLKVGAIAHGTLVTKEDIENVKSPIAMACVKNDNLFPDDIREQGRASLELNSVEHVIKVFDDVPHGFAVLGDYQDAKIREAQKEAFDLMTQWLESH